MFQKKETPKKLFIFEKIELSELKKSLLKCVLYFRKLNISTPTLKNYFLGESLRVFHHCFFRCFISTLIFTIVFGCFHCWLYLFTSWLFIQVFSFYYWFYYYFLSVSVSPTFFTETAFWQVLCFCVVAPRVLRIWNAFFFNLRCFLPYTLSQHLAQPAFITTSLGPVVQPWRLHSLPLRFETQIRPICLFESHNVQQKGISR